MATYRTSAAGGASAGTSNRTAVLTPVVGDLWVVFCYVAANTNDTPTCSDNNGGTYTRIQVANCVTSAINYRLSAFVRTSLHTNTTSTTVTVDTGSNTSGVVHIIAISGMTRANSSAVRSQGLQSNQAAGTAAPTLNQTSITSNLTLVAHGSADTTTTPPGGWTEAQDTSQTNDAVSLETAYRDSGFAGTTITFGAASSTTFCSMAIELDASLSATGSDTLDNWLDARQLGYGLIFSDDANNLADAYAQNVGVLLTFADTLNVYPEAFWRMESVSGGIVTDCRNTADLTVIGAPTAGAGKIGNAITFDGSGDGLSSGTSVPGLSTNGGSWTYWGWFKRASAENDYLWYLRNDSATGNTEVAISWLSSGVIDVVVGVTDPGGGPTMASDGNWHLLVVTYNTVTGNVEISVDNATPSVLAAYPNPTTGANTQLFVAQNTIGGDRLAGSIDAVGFGRFYATAPYRDAIWNAGNGLEFCLKDSLALDLQSAGATPLTQSASDDLNAWGDDLTGDLKNRWQDSLALNLQAAPLIFSDNLNNWIDDLTGNLEPRWQDSLVKSLSSAGDLTLTLSDSFTLTDGTATVSILSYDILVYGEDLNNWADAFTKQLLTSGALTLNLSDTLNNWNDFLRIGYGLIVSDDANNLADSMDKTLAGGALISIQVSDAITWSDAIKIGYGLKVSDTFTLTDSIVVRSSALTLTLSDSFTLTDALTRLGYGLKVSDQIVLTDAFQKNLSTGGFAVWQNIAAVTLTAANLASVTLLIQNLGDPGDVMYESADDVSLLTEDTDSTSIFYEDTDTAAIKHEDTDTV